MKNSISLLLCFALLSCFSLNLYPQSAEKKLDQVALLKQFIGTWEAEIGKDSVVVLIFTPLNNGLHVVQENKANGEAYLTYKGVFGLSNDKEMIIAAAIAPNGTMILDFGKFVDEDKYVIDRHFGNTAHVASLLEWEFITTESFVIRAKVRGNGMTWPNDWIDWFTFNKIN